MFNEDVEIGFWTRQFQSEPTTRQIHFDIAFGIVMPILCFILDPGILRPGNNPFLFRGNSIFIYLLSAISIPMLAIWLTVGRRLRKSGGLYAGVFMSGAVCSLAIGILLLPLSLIGLIFLIGILGFTPFLTAFVYLRNGVRALRQSKAYLSRQQVIASAGLSVVLVAGILAFAQWKIDSMVTRLTEDILGGQLDSTTERAEQIKYLRWLVDTDKIVWAYEGEKDSSRKDHLAKAYAEITGEDIEDRLQVLND